VKDALGASVEDTIIILVAVAMGLGVLDDHMVIGQLFFSGQIKTVQDTLDAFGCEPRADTISRQFLRRFAIE